MTRLPPVAAPKVFFFSEGGNPPPFNPASHYQHIPGGFFFSSFSEEKISTQTNISLFFRLMGGDRSTSQSCIMFKRGSSQGSGVTASFWAQRKQKSHLCVRLYFSSFVAPVDACVHNLKQSLPYVFKICSHSFSPHPEYIILPVYLTCTVYTDTFLTHIRYKGCVCFVMNPVFLCCVVELFSMIKHAEPVPCGSTNICKPLPIAAITYAKQRCWPRPPYSHHPLLFRSHPLSSLHTHACLLLGFCLVTVCVCSFRL